MNVRASRFVVGILLLGLVVQIPFAMAARAHTGAYAGLTNAQKAAVDSYEQSAGNGGSMSCGAPCRLQNPFTLTTGNEYVLIYGAGQGQQPSSFNVIGNSSGTLWSHGFNGTGTDEIFSVLAGTNATLMAYNDTTQNGGFGSVLFTAVANETLRMEGSCGFPNACSFLSSWSPTIGTTGDNDPVFQNPPPGTLAIYWNNGYNFNTNGGMAILLNTTLACVAPDVECQPYGATNSPLQPVPFRTWNESASVNLSWTYGGGTIPGTNGTGGVWEDAIAANDIAPATNAYVSPGYSGQSMTLNNTMNSVGNVSAGAGTGLDPTCDFSMGAWINRDASGNHHIVHKGNATLTTLYGLFTDNSFKAGWFVGSGGQIGPGTSPAFAIGVWYHIAGTYDCDTGSMLLYVNGSQVDSGTVGNPGYSTEPVHVGWNANPANSRWSGQLDNITLYNGTWTSGQVSSFATGTQPPATSAYYFENSTNGTPDTGIPVLGYNITRYNATSTVTFYTDNVTSWRDSNVTVGQHYNYTVRGWNQYGNGTPTYRFPGHAESSSAPVLAGAYVPCVTFALNWSAPNLAGLSGYRLYRNSSAYPVANRTFIIPPEGNFTLRLLNDTPYPQISAALSYRVVGVNASGNASPDSNVVNFTPPVISTVGDCGLAFGGMSEAEFLAMAGLTGANADALGILLSIILVLVGAAIGFAVMSAGGAVMGAGSGMLLSVAFGYLPLWAIMFVLVLLAGGYFMSKPGAGGRRRR